MYFVGRFCEAWSKDAARFCRDRLRWYGRSLFSFASFAAFQFPTTRSGTNKTDRGICSDGVVRVLSFLGNRCERLRLLGSHLRLHGQSYQKRYFPGISERGNGGPWDQLDRHSRPHGQNRLCQGL